MTELESMMWEPHSRKEIMPGESPWGRHFVKLKQGEKMVQYRIFWREPLDVVYDSGGRVVLILTSYE